MQNWITGTMLESFISRLSKQQPKLRHVKGTIVIIAQLILRSTCIKQMHLGLAY